MFEYAKTDRLGSRSDMDEGCLSGYTVDEEGMVGVLAGSEG